MVKKSYLRNSVKHNYIFSSSLLHVSITYENQAGQEEVNKYTAAFRVEISVLYMCIVYVYIYIYI